MKLSRALKQKNRIAKQIGLIKERIMENNSTYVDNEFTYKMTDLLKEYDELTNSLVELKAAIQLANIKIFHLIYTKSELQAKMQMLRSLDTRAGLQESRAYGSSDLHRFKVQLDKPSRDREIADLQERINKIQDEIDIFNAVTTIDIGPEKEQMVIDKPE